MMVCLFWVLSSLSECLYYILQVDLWTLSSGCATVWASVSSWFIFGSATGSADRYPWPCTLGCTRLFLMNTAIQFQAAEPTLKSLREGGCDRRVLVKEGDLFQGYISNLFPTKIHSYSNILRILSDFFSVQMNLTFKASIILCHASLKQLNSISGLNLKYQLPYLSSYLWHLP